MSEYAQEYKGYKLVDIPSGMGGVLPAVIAKEYEDEYSVICLHEEYFTNWVLTVKKSNTRPMSYRLNFVMQNIIDKRMHPYELSSSVSDYQAACDAE